MAKLTHRQARQKLGSRTTRRAGTNRKKGQVVFKYRYARKVSRKVAVRVAKLVKDSLES